MITTPTVFILGAGASYPYEYPLGEELRKHLYKSSSISLSDISRIADLRTSFRESSTASIDQFLNRNQEFGDLGKEMITAAIFEYERRSKFRESTERSGDWYTYLFRHMTETLNEPDSYNDFKNNTVSFITFNYDRSLEHFFYQSLRNSFISAEADKIFEQFKSIPIHHVYGRLPNLPFENSTSNVPYGPGNQHSLSPMSINQYSKNIKIMYERQESEYEEMTDIIRHAERIFFLGFGFAKENVERLKINEALDYGQAIFGTAFGHTEKEKVKFVQTLVSGIIDHSLKSQLRKGGIKLEDCDCLQLLRDWL